MTSKQLAKVQYPSEEARKNAAQSDAFFERYGEVQSLADLENKNCEMSTAQRRHLDEGRPVLKAIASRAAKIGECQQESLAAARLVAGAALNVGNAASNVQTQIQKGQEVLAHVEKPTHNAPNVTQDIVPPPKRMADVLSQYPSEVRVPLKYVKR